MPTESNQWLNRDVADQGADKLIALACPLLREGVNKATLVFEECQRAPSGTAGQDLPVMLAFLHLIEMVDAVEVLLSSSSVHPAKLLVRSVLEASLTINYIFKADTRRRSFAWLVSTTRRKLAAYEAFSSKTPAGREFRVQSANDDFRIDLDAVPQGQVDAAIDNLKSLLTQQNYSEGEREFQRLKKEKRGRSPNWFSFYGGPNDLYQLAKHMGQLTAYQLLYRQWSELTHAGDGARWLTKTKLGEAAFFALRNPSELLGVANYAASYLLDAMRVMTQRYVPDQDLTRWYIDGFQAGYLKLATTQINVVERDIPGK